MKADQHKSPVIHGLQDLLKLRLRRHNLVVAGFPPVPVEGLRIVHDEGVEKYMGNLGRILADKGGLDAFVFGDLFCHRRILRPGTFLKICDGPVIVILHSQTVCPLQEARKALILRLRRKRFRLFWRLLTFGQLYFRIFFIPGEMRALKGQNSRNHQKDRQRSDQHGIGNPVQQTLFSHSAASSFLKFPIIPGFPVLCFIYLKFLIHNIPHRLCAPAQTALLIILNAGFLRQGCHKIVSIFGNTYRLYSVNLIKYY